MWTHVGTGRFWPIGRLSTDRNGVAMYISQLMAKRWLEVLPGTTPKPEMGKPDDFTFREVATQQGPDGPFLTITRAYFEKLKEELKRIEQEVVHVETGKRLFEF